MALRTPEAYLEGLRDGRVVYYRGERVADVPAHPALGRGARHVAIDFRLAEDPAYRDLAVAQDPQTGRAISRYFLIPRTGTDLLQRRLLIETVTREARAVVPLVKEIGTDALFALMVVAAEHDEAAPYAARIRAFYEHCRDGDLTMAVAQTDVKGDRSLRPHQQPNPDAYVRVVAQRPDGIVVRGAKAHTTNAVLADEIIVVPTRAMGPEDHPWAVAFAVPAATPGLRFIASPRGYGATSPFDNPVSAQTKMVESLTIFDDVFVPSERVFLNGEYRAAGALAKTFVEFHRFTAVAYKPPLLELLAGAAALLADYNGVARAGHVRDKLAALVMYLETVRGLTKAAALDCRLRAGIAVPDVVYTNAAKYYFAAHYHEMVRLVQDIAGGLVVTGPTEEDWQHPQTRRDLDAFLAGSPQATAEQRLRALNLVRDVTASDFGGYLEVLAIHAEGSLEAQKLTILMDVDLEPYKAYARRLAGIA
ncbi:MAG: 4-hydroxyphenylacetate 3-hydroxylase N-terminal domain-containing protein [Armatimonadota bacterium]|nr:4-hydroxyphenylacetate 3-hydroxylase N-terminal domain-containing protein [Armatimonadota bacterium]MDR7485737.1 4-hydroxyphenylacetate 3-hydroxylase N-terminal domain-containing protein [Armatimonadota bacterium]MDR7536401.1 4-hydroxyphenylacetate 3-hydroxylase N-terminal domain-containing protein [Armatimonadota bacterium]